ncbi:hypothetical protein [Roseimaritima sediminicola]|uniref:hypothetical protein n=1 Tax=Roseimaritima sediminicola TaxID=2662066 RepID=UPI0012984CA6|nr:hypothetical protein [Roseimaritima sediminicola]
MKRRFIIPAALATAMLPYSFATAQDGNVNANTGVGNSQNVERAAKANTSADASAGNAGANLNANAAGSQNSSGSSVNANAQGNLNTQGAVNTQGNVYGAPGTPVQGAYSPSDSWQGRAYQGGQVYHGQGYQGQVYPGQPYQGHHGYAYGQSGAVYGQPTYHSGYSGGYPSHMASQQTHVLRYDASGREFICVGGQRVYFDNPAPAGNLQPMNAQDSDYSAGYNQYDTMEAPGQDAPPAPNQEATNPNAADQNDGPNPQDQQRGNADTDVEGAVQVDRPDAEAAADVNGDVEAPPAPTADAAADTEAAAEAQADQAADAAAEAAADVDAADGEAAGGVDVNVGEAGAEAEADVDVDTPEL